MNHDILHFYKLMMLEERGRYILVNSGHSTTPGVKVGEGWVRYREIAVWYKNNALQIFVCLFLPKPSVWLFCILENPLFLLCFFTWNGIFPTCPLAVQEILITALRWGLLVYSTHIAACLDSSFWFIWLSPPLRELASALLFPSRRNIKLMTRKT